MLDSAILLLNKRLDAQTALWLGRLDKILERLNSLEAKVNTLTKMVYEGLDLTVMNTQTGLKYHTEACNYP